MSGEFKSSVIYRVAHAICEANPSAGQSYGADAQQPTATRAQNLIVCDYVREGDPQEWGGGSADATIYLEGKGCADDCRVPWSDWDHGIGVSVAAMDRLRIWTEGHAPLPMLIETINPAVACVYLE